MSIFASRTQKTIDLTFDPPHAVTIQKLTGRHIGKAEREHQAASVEMLKRFGGAAFQREMSALGDVAEAVTERQKDPLNSYDVPTLLLHGIVGWTYDEQVTPETLADLTAEASDFIARAILRLTKPALFHTSEELEDAQKKESGPSIAH